MSQITTEKKQPWPRCMFCCVNPKTNTLQDAMRTIKKCNNCKVDILTGDWTGHGTDAIRVLIERFGKEAVEKEWGKP